MSQPQAPYRRVVLKISGEMLGDGCGECLAADALAHVAGQIAQAAQLGCELAVVVGGGNIVRGAAFSAQRERWRVQADQMGMLATGINATALRLQLASVDVPAVVLSAWPMGPVCDAFTVDKCDAALGSGQVVLLAAGTGHPFFTTDTAAALRALEIQADALFKATKVDGVYDADPKQNPNAKRYDVLTYEEAIDRRLRVMDQTAFALCREYALPILVFDLLPPGNVARAVAGEQVGTLVRER